MKPAIDQASKKFFNLPPRCLALILALFFIAVGVSSAGAASLSLAPMVGAVTDTTAKIWIRADGVGSAVVQYQLAGGNWSQPFQSTAQSLVAANDFTATFSLAGLGASTTYDYRVLLDGLVQANSTAVFKTLPPVGNGAKFNFIFGADIHPGSAPHTPFSIMAGEQADFALLLGDQIYHTVDSGTESEFWTLYKANRDSFFQAFAKSTPIFTVWDDGDFGQDSGDSSYPFKNLARAAFGKYWANPPYVESNGAVYYKFSVADVDFFMLDSRWGRINGVTLLGAAQLQWLKTELLASTARFKFIVSPVMVSDFGKTGNDSWKGYPAERTNLFQHIAANNIKNVIFLSGDQHWAGAFLINYPVFQIGHGIQGFYEVEPTPISGFKIGAPRQNDPQVLFQADLDNFYGLVRVDTTVVPRQVQIEIRSGTTGAMVYSLPIEEFTPTSTPTITTAVLSQGTVNAPYAQQLTAVDGVAPYLWQVSNGSFPSGLSLNSNGLISGTPSQAATFFFTARVQDSTGASTTRTFPLTINSDTVQTVLLNQNFSGTLSAWTIVDEGTLEGPSSWVVSGGRLIQQSNIYGGSTSAADPVKPGTFIYSGNASWSNYEFNASLLSLDDDALGVMFRYQNRQNYYRFSMDKERSVRRLTKTANGVTTILAQDSVPYVINRWYALKVRVNGSAIQVFVDGVLLFNVSDGAIPTGGVGLYSWANAGSYFDDVTVTTLAGQPASAPTVQTTSLANGAVNGAYNQGLAASGGSLPYSWSLVSGALPQGLNLAADGTISGTPVAAGTSGFTVQVRDAALQTATQALNLTVTQGGVSLTANPSSAAPGSSVSATWSGITNPTGADWIGLFRSGSGDGSYLDWLYVTCSKGAGASGIPSGSCSFGLSGTLTTGSYEFRLFANNGSIRIATSSQFTVGSLPVVSVVASIGNAAEGGASGQFTFSRTGSTASALTVSYSVGGTAAGGADYTALNGTVNIPANATSTTLAVAPIDDATVEGSESVIVTLGASANYAIGSPASATIIIADNDFIPTVSITGGTFGFDGNPHGATGFAYGNGGVNDVLSPPVTISYQGTGVTSYGPSSIPPTNVGTYVATANFAGNVNYLPASNNAGVTINNTTATLTLSGLSQVFNGTARAATVTTNPLGLSGVSITYNGNASAPVNAGTYSVVASLTNPNYSAANALGTLTIGKATPSLSLTGGTFSFDGNAHGASGFAYGAGGLAELLAPSLTFVYQGTGATAYGPSSTAPIVAGTYLATGSFAGNANYNSAIGSVAIAINQASGTLLTVTPTTSQPGATVTANWSGIANPQPLDWIGFYAVGSPDTSYLAWVYVSCSRTAGSGAVAGSCPFVLPGSLAQGNYELRLLANNGFTRLATSPNLTISAGAAAPTITTTSLPNGRVNASYSQTLAASAGTSPYSWSVVAGALPSGLTIASNGTISGVPTASGTTTFTAQVRDSALVTATKGFTIVVDPATVTPTISLNFEGLTRDRVGQAELAAAADGKLDGVFGVTLNAGSGNRTVTRLFLTNIPGGVWDTQAPDIWWTLGAATGLDTPLLNGANDTVNFPLSEGSSFKIFAADSQGQMFLSGTVFTLTADFADGSSATATTTVNNLAGFSDNFSGTFANWTIVDEGLFEGPSRWVISNGELYQTSNIWSGSTSGSDPVKPGTYAVAGNALWRDYDFSLRLLSEDNDAIGVMFRYQDGQNYYRFSMDSERGYRRLVKVVNGVTTILAQDNTPYVTGQSYSLRVSLTGNRVQVFLGLTAIFDVFDSSLASGKIGLYSWGNVNSRFDDVVVTPH